MKNAHPPFDMVLFGGTGDLVIRKLLPALYHMHQDKKIPDGRIICLGRSQPDTAAYIAAIRPKVENYLKDSFTEQGWESFISRIVFLQLDVNSAADFETLRDLLDQHPDRARIFYLSTSPDLFSGICQHLGKTGLNRKQARVVLEKPLGNDLDSSNEINDTVAAVFEEQQIYRIDHYLGKEPVQNLMALRFGNTLLEPLWRRDWISDVQITVTEQVGVESRAAFYDKTGALRDMVQNHLLQLLCMVAMEPPASINADAVRDEKLKVLRSLQPLDPESLVTKVVRGQYRAGASEGQPVAGYLDEPGVAPYSQTETFVAIKTEICSWRWSGVPFYLRTGKRMSERLAEIVVNFRKVPHSIFGRQTMMPNRLVIQLQPKESVRLHMMAKQPGDQMRLSPVYLDLDFKEVFHTRAPAAYERLLMDVIRGDLSLFVRRDEQVAAWTWVEPIFDAWENNPEGPKPYTAGSWGPAASSALLSRDGLCWHEEA